MGLLLNFVSFFKLFIPSKGKKQKKQKLKKIHINAHYNRNINENLKREFDLKKFKDEKKKKNLEEYKTKIDIKTLKRKDIIKERLRNKKSNSQKLWQAQLAR